MDTHKGVFFWGYIHFFIFSTVAVIGVGLTVINEAVLLSSSLNTSQVSLVLIIPLMIYLFVIWLIIDKPKQQKISGKLILPLTAICIGLTYFAAHTILFITFILCIAVGLRHILLRSNTN